MAQATRKTTKHSTGKSSSTSPRVASTALPVAGLLLAALALMALWSFDPTDIGWSHVATFPKQPSNWLGSQGAALADVLMSLLGLGAYGVPLALITLSIQTLLGVRGALLRRLSGWVVLLPAWSALLWWLHDGPVISSGGLIGEAVGSAMVVLFGVIGGLALLLIAVMGLLWSAGVAVGMTLDALGTMVLRGAEQIMRLRPTAPAVAVPPHGFGGGDAPHAPHQENLHLPGERSGLLEDADTDHPTADHEALQGVDQDDAMEAASTTLIIADDRRSAADENASGRREQAQESEKSPPGHEMHGRTMPSEGPLEDMVVPLRRSAAASPQDPIMPDTTLLERVDAVMEPACQRSDREDREREDDQKDWAQKGLAGSQCDEVPGHHLQRGPDRKEDSPVPCCASALASGGEDVSRGDDVASPGWGEDASPPMADEPRLSWPDDAGQKPLDIPHRPIDETPQPHANETTNNFQSSGPDVAPAPGMRPVAPLRQEWGLQGDGCPWEEDGDAAHEAWAVIAGPLDSSCARPEGADDLEATLLDGGGRRTRLPHAPDGSADEDMFPVTEEPRVLRQGQEPAWLHEGMGKVIPLPVIRHPVQKEQEEGQSCDEDSADLQSLGHLVRYEQLPVPCEPADKKAAVHWEGPAIELLNEPNGADQRCDPEVLQEMASQVEQRFCDFGIDVQVTEVLPGPVITRFELMPARGVKVSQIVNLGKDLARALSVTSVRVVEVVPGKSVVGLEIPSEQRQLICLRDLLQTDAFMEARSPMTIVLGKDISGEAIVADLARMPHLLVAGTTGSGKSVGINAMILSLLYKSSPEDVRLILIDPKILELSVYEGIPHLLAPVVTDMRDAAKALSWCVGEMERRYRLMYHMGVRNLGGFNQKIEEARARGQPILDPFDDQGGHLEFLPAIVVVVDEFADLMMVVGKKIEHLIARLAQKARAAGIHLILATQRPSVDVITGLIKANIPTRIAFQVSSKIDSRTILDQNGAESLLGAGDMLYLPPGTGLPIRVHGAFVSDDEVHRVVADLKERYGSRYVVSAFDAPGAGGGTGDGLDEGDGAVDPAYDEAVALVTRSRRASISNVQRQLRIGYNRAARLVEEMERQGVVGPPETNGNREVLVPPPPEGP